MDGGVRVAIEDALDVVMLVVIMWCIEGVKVKYGVRLHSVGG